MLRKTILISSLSLAMIVAIACGSDGPTCGNTRCASGQTCCSQCGTSTCADKCVAISCASDSGPGVQCGTITCQSGEVCCTGCQGEKSCGQACPGIMCPDDAGADAPDDSDASSAGDAGSD